MQTANEQKNFLLPLLSQNVIKYENVVLCGFQC